MTVFFIVKYFKIALILASPLYLSILTEYQQLRVKNRISANQLETVAKRISYYCNDALHELRSQ